MFLETFIYAGLIPLAAAALIAFALRRSGITPPATWASAVACGFITAQLALKSQAGFATAFRALVQPSDASEWLSVFVLLALGISFLLMNASPARWRGEFVLAAAFTISVPLRLLSLHVGHMQEWSPLEKLAHLSLAAATLGVIWLLLGSGGESQSSFARAFCVAIVAVGAAIVLSLSGVFVYGQYCGAIAAALAGASLALFVGATGSAGAPRRFTLSGFTGAAGVVTFSLGSLILLGYFFGDLRAANAALLVVALAAAGAPLPAVLLAWPSWQQFLLRTAACLTPLAFAIASVVN